MPTIGLTWRTAATLAVLLVAVAAALPRLPRSRRWAAPAAVAAREASLVVGLFALWQLVGSHTHTRVAGAFSHARTLFAWEQALRLPSEVDLQRAVLPHPALVHAVDTYYLYGHFNVMIGLLAWLFLRHRPQYAPVRNLVVVTTGLCLAVQVVPVAPPRMLTDLGFVDMALRYGESAYGPNGSGIAPQLAAMPSVHVAWALIVGVVVVRVSRSRWRWLAAAHAVLMSLVVVVTANHWWADGIVAGALIAVAWALVAAGGALVRRMPSRAVAVVRPRAAADVPTGAPVPGAVALPAGRSG